MTSKSLLAASAALMGLALAGGAHAYGSDYTLTSSLGGLQPEGTYANLPNPYDLRSDGAWGSYLSPTGTGDFEVVNGGGDPTMRFYYETVSLVAGTTYQVAADVVDNYSANPPILQMTVDGAAVGASQTLTLPYGEFQNPSNSLPATPGPWIIHDFSFTPTVSGNHVIAFVDLETAAAGNDFSFDPLLSGVAVPEPAAWALMIVGLFGLGATLRGRRGAALAG